MCCCSLLLFQGPSYSLSVSRKVIERDSFFPSTTLFAYTAVIYVTAELA